MKYKIEIPKPSASRLAENVKVVIQRYSGWGGGGTTMYELESGATEFEFEVEDDRPWHSDSKVFDGPEFMVKVRYSNASGSRTEDQEVRPEKLS